MTETVKDLLNKIELSDVQKVYIDSSNNIVGIDCDIYHIRLDNVGRNKNVSNIVKLLYNRISDGDRTLPVIKEIL
jgi:hypothetical protein